MQFRSTRTCDAVQWFPGVDIAGIHQAPDDMAYRHGWPSGSFYHESVYSRALQPGDWIVTTPTGSVDVLRDDWFRKEWEQCDG